MIRTDPAAVLRCRLGTHPAKRGRMRYELSWIFISTALVALPLFAGCTAGDEGDSASASIGRGDVQVHDTDIIAPELVQ